MDSRPFECSHVEVFEIAVRMKKVGLPCEFVIQAIKLAVEYEGGYDLLNLWDEETDQKERDALIECIEDTIMDCKIS